jgi:hypothetical protein
VARVDIVPLLAKAVKTIEHLALFIGQMALMSTPLNWNKGILA